MTDTSPQMQQKQFEIYQAKSLDQKFQMVVDMMEYGVKQTISVLRTWYPAKSEPELKLEFFRLYYRDDFDERTMERWIAMLEKG